MSAMLCSPILGERLASRENGHRTDASVFPPRRRTATCRNLFGPVDHAEIQRELKTKLREITERDQQKWNFDFGEGKPLDGDLKWEESPALDCPEFYRETTPVSNKIHSDLLVAKTTSQIQPKCVKASSKNVLYKLTRTGYNNRGKLSHKRKRVQKISQTNMRITDFFGKRKKMDSIRKESKDTA
ncbi:hypothetical protein DNTS_002032 [Danionella cerebrum]|uniref:Cyclin-dependent kinase inhibitor domain-containing protein n=1 Tax=Danionella cerebrum TaxID=2873325 RepID=A0A553NI83_9TELE|nr:hypothetical protein DNTS_002032 [Danionella translucida]